MAYLTALKLLTDVWPFWAWHPLGITGGTLPPEIPRARIPRGRGVPREGLTFWGI